MAHILLLCPPPSTNRTPEENLGLEYLAAESSLSGHQVTYLDAWMEQLDVDSVVASIIGLHPDVVGISPSMDSIDNSIVIADSLKAAFPQIHLVFGGIYASFEAENILSQTDSLDGILTGECDYTFQEYLKNYRLSRLPGAYYKKNSKVVKTPKQSAPDNLDLLPFPHRHLDLVKKWHTPSHVMGSRGCYGNCSFCSVACFQKFSSDKRWRGRSPQNLVSELIDLSRAGETMVKFIDDNFFAPGDKSREKEIAQKIISSGINLRFRLSLRVNDVDDDSIKLLKQAGLFAVSLGVESFVQRKLNDYSKGTTVAQNIAAIDILKKHGILVQMGFIMFDPFMTLDEVKQELAGLSATRWAITKGIWTRLFAADGTRITDRIEREIGFVGKEGANNLYEIRDPQARLFQKYLSLWARYLNQSYEKAIDPISAPKNLPSADLQTLHSVCVAYKDMDIALALILVGLIKNNAAEGDLKSAVDIFISQNQAGIDSYNHEVDQIYRKNNLEFFSSGNRRV